jgi:NADPH2:quinone reductase
MLVIHAPQPGGPDALQAADWPMPVASDDDVLIRVAAAGLNRADILQRRGHYPAPPGAPTNPGLEVSGIVEDVGTNVRDFRRGDSVCALLQGGGYSEYCVVNADQVLPVPAQLNMVEAAALPEACFTVWSNLYEFGRLQAGESLLVHGGSSGIGSFAIQIAAALGSTVYVTAGSAEKTRFCEALGARRAINYRTEDFVTAIASLTDQRGVDVILDMVGGSYLPRNLAALAIEGRLVTIATQGGSKAEIDLLQVMQRRLVITGSTLRSRDTAFKRRIRDQLLRTVWPLLAAGSIRPIIDRTFSLTEASAAHAWMESSVHMGKIVLTLA